MTRIAFALLLAVLVPPAFGQGVTPPEARRVAVVDTLHGVAVADPYRWLEDLGSEEVRRFAREQNAAFDRWLASVPEREAIRRRIAEIADVERNGPFYLRGERVFFSGRDPGLALLYLDVREPDGSTRRVVGAEDVLESPDDRVASFVVDPTARRTTVALRTGQSIWRRVRIREVASGTMHPEVLVGILSPVVWDADGEGFFYVFHEPPAPGEERTARVASPRVRYHRVGTPQSEDRTVYEDPAHPDRTLAPFLTADGRWLLVHAVDGGTFLGLADRVLAFDLADATAAPRVILEEEGAQFAAIEARDSRLWFRTDHAAPRGRILSLDLEDPDGGWTEVIPEAAGTIQSASLIGGRLVVVRMDEARPRLAVHDLDGTLVHRVELPDIGIAGMMTGDPARSTALFAFNSLYEVGSLYGLDVETGEVEALRRPRLAFDPDAFTTRQVFYASADGTRIPMFVAHLKDAVPDGTRSAFLYAYGAYAWIAFPWFQPHIIAWLERGGVYALPNVRGGGVYGEAWHVAGRRRNKENTIADFVAAAEWLVGNGWARPDGVVANGGSASGVVAAAASIRRPDLFGATVVDIPTLDMIRHHLFTTAASRIPEFGTADDPEDFAALLRYSPYHSVEPGTCYPPTLILVGERDEIAPPLHGYKHAAALQQAQACDAPVFVHTIAGAGHAYGTDAEQVARTWGDAWAFLERTVGIEPREAPGANRR